MKKIWVLDYLENPVIIYGGKGGIRTHGALEARRFSRPLPSTTRTPFHAA